MKKIISFVLCCILAFNAFIVNAATNFSPVGFWQTIDDVSHRPKAILEITENDQHILSAHILKIYPKPGYDQNALCTACKGEKHNQRIVGMRILENVKPDKKNARAWVDGQILDPNNGKTYHCDVLLSDDNQRLQVRGYVGVPLFGRTQIWNRAHYAI
jgi:uncharacterized protein (DUF2147 family)